MPKNAIKLDPKQETLTIALPDELSQGKHTLALNFPAKSTRRDRVSITRPIRARTGAKKTCWERSSKALMLAACSVLGRAKLPRAFPNYRRDSENWTAVSNMTIERQTKTAAGKEVQFGATPSMASYLNVLCAGDSTRSRKKSGDVCIASSPLKVKRRWPYALESAQQINRVLQRLLGTRSLPKLDEIAVRGLRRRDGKLGRHHIFESRLLFDPDNSPPKRSRESMP